MRVKSRALSGRNIANIPKEILDAIDDETERAALRAINDARENAPRDTGALVNSIRMYGRKAKLRRTIGSDRPYAARQEYEHKSKRGFFRKAIFKERITFRENIERILKRAGG